MGSDPDLLDAYHKQLRAAKDAGHDPAIVFLGWQRQEGVTRDDLISGLKAAAGADGPVRCWCTW